MNKILTTSISDPTIGQPLTGKSLEFLQNANKEVAAGIIQGLIGQTYATGTYYVVSGLEPYGTNQFYAGYVYKDGELYYSAGKATTTAFTNVPILTLTVTNDATADPLTFTDNVSRNVHNVRRMVMSDAVSGTGTVDLSNCVYVSTSWITVGSGLKHAPNLTAPTFQNSWVDSGEASNALFGFKKEKNSLFIRGRIKNGTSGLTIFTLPVGYRPIYNIRIIASSIVYSSEITIDTSGNVVVIFTGSPTDINIGMIEFPLD